MRLRRGTHILSVGFLSNSCRDKHLAIEFVAIYLQPENVAVHVNIMCVGVVSVHRQFTLVNKLCYQVNEHDNVLL